eukprot:scaffold21237_cov74-Cylindrotheca_fusiformis.AAC.1
MDDFGGAVAVESMALSADQMNATIANGVEVFSEDMDQLNDTGMRLAEFDRNIVEVNEQLGTANANLEEGINQGIGAFEEQANDLNRTAEETAQDIRHAADAFEGTA